MAPDLHREVEPDQACHPCRPAACGVDDDGRGERPPGRLDSCHRPGDDRDRRHLGSLDEPGPTVSRRLQEARGHRRRIRVPGSGLMGGHVGIVDRERRAQPSDLVGPDHRRLDAKAALHRDVRAEEVGPCPGLHPQEARPDEAAVAPDALRPVPEPRVRRPREAGLGGQVVVHPHQAARTPGRAGRDRRPLDHHDLRPARGQVVGETGALDPRPDDDDIRCLGHVVLPSPSSGAHSGSRSRWSRGASRTGVLRPALRDRLYAIGSKRAWKKRRYFGS